MYDFAIYFLELGGVTSCSTATLVVRGASFGKLAGVGAADFFLEEVELLSLMVILA